MGALLILHLVFSTVFTAINFLLILTALFGHLYLLAHSQANTTHSAVPEGFQLATERRAKERLEFERTRKDKETMRMQMEEQLTREREEQEKEEIARLRHEQVLLLNIALWWF